MTAQNKLKALEFWTGITQRIIAILVTVVPIVVGAVFFIIGGIDRQIDKKLDEKLKPVNSYIIGSIVLSIEKNYEKIQNDKEDIKIVDLESCMTNWEFIKALSIPDYVVVEQKLETIKKYYAMISNKPPS